MKYIASFIGEKDIETANHTIVFDGTDVIVGTWNSLYSSSNDVLIRINRYNMTRKDPTALPVAFPTHLVYLDSYLYTSTDHPTGVVLRIKK